MSSQKQSLKAVILRYARHPQFLGLEIGDDPNQRGAMGDTLLHLAVESGNLEDMKVLVAAGANIDAVGDIGNTPLHSAALRGNFQVAKKLIEFGANTRLKNDFGETALDVAKNGKRNDIAVLLSRSFSHHC